MEGGKKVPDKFRLLVVVFFSGNTGNGEPFNPFLGLQNLTITVLFRRRSKGLAYVEFYLQEATLKALALSGQPVKGQAVRVQPSQSEKNRAAQAAKASIHYTAPRETPLRLYVGGLTDSLANISEEELKKLFSPFGEIEFIDLHRDPYTNKCKGFAFVQFKNASEAREAMTAMNGFQLAGKELKVGIATSDMQLGEGGQPANLAIGCQHNGTECSVRPGMLKDANDRLALMQKLQRDPLQAERDTGDINSLMSFPQGEGTKDSSTLRRCADFDTFAQFLKEKQTKIIGGVLSAERAKTISARQEGLLVQAGDAYAAAALSMVLHTVSPWIPTFRSDVRIFCVTAANGQESAWLGGGADLTPYYLTEEDVRYFHGVYKNLCNTALEGIPNFCYTSMKQACDEYFYLPARQEHRGTGGIFFDDLPVDEESLGFVEGVVESWMPSWLPIVTKRRGEAYTEKQKHWQLLRRGRYLEFNLLYDRGVKFGLANANPRVEGVMVSAPPKIAFEYNHKVEEGSAEEALMKVLHGMFNPSQVNLAADPEFFNDIHADVEQECRKYGSVIKVFADQGSSKGDVWVKFVDATSAANCQRALDRRIPKHTDHREAKVSNWTYLVFEAFPVAMSFPWVILGIM
ncbi:Oxygen-dependent coproporphyrinogen-III oxidase (COX) (Coprogen oxidase) (Coproporphyrinogenase) [Durusdinium trenchii]|uniref:Oxygen-dependent coproporphyrinogen-III oxidase (COX) (Coprogen oxidase) (Coproporphyrinogenase) n=1 Tax=Durusdinium trenchii TaxID=1381693 RepID=A0ABP0IE44_9DINO